MQQRLIEEIMQLPVEERMVLIERISESVREDITRQQGDKVEVAQENISDSVNWGKLTISQKLHGSIKLDKVPQTKEEVREMIADYLTEKYS